VPDIQLAVELWLSSLPANEFRALCDRTRPPDEPLVDRADAQGQNPWPPNPEVDKETSTA
jgi:hypothetical protein